MHYFDAHTHAHFSAFQEDKDEVIRRALQAGVWMVNVGTQRDTSRDAVFTARSYETGVYAAVGLHPIHTAQSYYDADELGSGEDTQGFVSREEDFDFDYYKELALEPRVVAIGECGLDYNERGEHKPNRERQREAFGAQIELAAEVGKPLMIHCREAFADVLEILEENRGLLLGERSGIAHFFTGTESDMKRFLDLGFYLTFGGVITITDNFSDLVRLVPEDRILSETDAPYVAPAGHRGKRNEPAFVTEVVKKIADLRGLPEEEAARITFENAMRVFGLRIEV